MGPPTCPYPPSVGRAAMTMHELRSVKIASQQKEPSAQFGTVGHSGRASTVTALGGRPRPRLVIAKRATSSQTPRSTATQVTTVSPTAKVAGVGVVDGELVRSGVSMTFDGLGSDVVGGIGLAQAAATISNAVHPAAAKPRIRMKRGPTAT